MVQVHWKVVPMLLQAGHCVFSKRLRFGEVTPNFALSYGSIVLPDITISLSGGISISSVKAILQPWTSNSFDKHETNQRNTNYRDRSSTPFPCTYGRLSPQNHQQQRNFPQEDTFERPRQWQRFNENNRTQTQNRPHLNQGNENRSSWRPTRRPENPMRRANRFQ